MAKKIDPDILKTLNASEKKLYTWLVEVLNEKKNKPEVKKNEERSK